MTNVRKIPEGYHTITPYLVMRNAAEAIEFYKKAFNAKESCVRLPDSKGRIMHAELQIGDSRFMLCDEMPEMNAKGPEAYGGSPMSLMLYVENVDVLFKQAISAGATEIRAVSDQFYGDRTGTLKDPFGHAWTLSTHIEDVPEDELKRRVQKMQASSSSQTSGQ